MVKITFLGAGSAFAPRLAIDIFRIPDLDEGELCLVDIDKERLELSFKATQKINERIGKNWRIVSSTERREVMEGSDYIINCIEVSGVKTVKFDYEIPLKYGQVVEVPCLVDKNGVTPTYFGSLPPQVAALCKSNMAVYELTVKGILERNYDALLQAFLLDPLTSAVCSLEETKGMFDELLKAEKDYLKISFDNHPSL
jgi:alpha-galactosidase/6-phospho-beta-glucosidase family protein